MGGCQNYGPFLGTLNIRGRIIMGTPQRIIILTTTQMKHDIRLMNPESVVSDLRSGLLAFLGPCVLKLEFKKFGHGWFWCFPGPKTS